MTNLGGDFELLAKNLVLVRCWHRWDEVLFNASTKTKQRPREAFWDHVLDLKAEPMTPVAMELRASPKAPRLTLLMDVFGAKLRELCDVHLIPHYYSHCSLEMYLVARVEEGSESSTGAFA